MITIAIENVHDIIVDTTKYETKIDFKDNKNSSTTIEISRKDAELLLERLQEALNKI